MGNRSRKIAMINNRNGQEQWLLGAVLYSHENKNFWGKSWAVLQFYFTSGYEHIKNTYSLFTNQNQLLIV